MIEFNEGPCIDMPCSLTYPLWAVQVAVAFAEMHDTPVRMMAKEVLHGIIPWSQARPFLAMRLRRR